ncbi:NADH dehydrogenase Ndh1 domain protein [Mycobacterium xenopi 3993]|nr:NADH dehydrogenase Ndh1 domain protein [Mycobacterium xenopi 3993]
MRWSTGQPPASANAVLWTVGRVRPNTGWLPTELLDGHGFVRVTPDLRIPGHSDLFAVGDVAVASRGVVYEPVGRWACRSAVEGGHRVILRTISKVNRRRATR